ncbi:MAG: DUF2190 family protein [Bacteroidales bacterium]|nr:DUF2190 family protein [Bacteroidales bacterium]
MAAYEIPNLRFSGEAGGNIARRRFVKVNSSEQIVQAGAGDSVIGVSSQPASAGEVAEIYDGIVMVEAGDAIQAGTDVESDDQGRAVPISSGRKAGCALTSTSAAGELVSVKL